MNDSNALPVAVALTLAKKNKSKKFHVRQALRQTAEFCLLKSFRLKHDHAVSLSSSIPAPLTHSSKRINILLS